MEYDQVDHDGNDAILSSDTRMKSIINLEISELGISIISRDD